MLSSCLSGTKHYQLYPGAAKPAAKLAKLTVDPEILVLKISKYYDKTPILSFDMRVKQYDILPGTYTIKMKYHAIIELKGDDLVKISSQPFDVEFKAKKGKRYKLNFKNPTNFKDAKKFAAAPNVTIEEIN